MGLVDNDTMAESGVRSGIGAEELHGPGGVVRAPKAFPWGAPVRLRAPGGPESRPDPTQPTPSRQGPRVASTGSRLGPPIRMTPAMDCLPRRTLQPSPECWPQPPPCSSLLL